MKKTLQLFTLLLIVISIPLVGVSQTLNQNFDGATFPPTLWTLPSGSGAWTHSSEVADHTTSSGYFARYDCYNASFGNVANMVTPPLKITSTDKTFSFWTKYYLVSGTWGNTASLYVDVSNDGGTTWTSGTTNIINNMQDSAWFQTSIDLGSYESQNFVGDTVVVRFRGISDYGSYNIAIDDVVGPAIDASFNELQITKVIGDFGGFNPGTSDSVKVLVKNNGLSAQTNIPLKYTLDGGTMVVDTMASLASFAIDTFTFATTINVSSTGLHILKTYCDLANEEDRTNDTLVKNIVTPTNTPVPYATNYPNDYDLHTELIHNSGSITEINSEASRTSAGNGIFMTSNKDSYYVFAQADVEDAFTNTDQITEANMKIDASTSTYLSMEFDLKTQTAYTNCTWVRVMINDSIYAKTLAGDSVWQDNLPWQTLTLDLNDYAGSIFTISFQGALKYNEAKAFPGNKVYIDNLNLYVPASNDIEVSSIIDYHGGISGAATSPVRVIVKNNGVLAQTNVPIKYKVDNGTVISDSMASIAALSSDTFTFSSPMASPSIGSHNLMVYSTLTGDEDNTNDTASQIFNTYGANSFPLTEDFESGFTYFNQDYFNQVDFVVDTTLYHSGSQSAFNAYEANNDNKLEESGALDLTSTTNPVLDFWHIAKLETPNYDYGLVEISTDNGLTWTALPDSLYMGNSTNYSTGHFDEGSYSEWGTADVTPDNTWWKMERFSLAPYKTTGVRVRFNLHSDSGVQHHGWNIDDVSIKEEPVPVVNLGNDTNFCGGSTLTINAGIGYGYSYLWIKNGTDTLASTTNNLTLNTAGTYVVQATNSAGTASDTIIVGALPFITFNSLANTCANETNYTLTGATPANGYYTGMGVDSTTGIFDPSINGAGNYDITYTYTDANGCTNSAVQTIGVLDVPNISVTAGANPVPYNTATTLSATVSNALGSLSYLWTPDANINGDSSLQTVNTENITAVTMFYVEVMDDSTSCSNTDSINITYSGGPLSINPIGTPTTICEGDTISLSAQSAGGTGTITYAWTSNPSGFTSANENPNATPNVDTWFILNAISGNNTVADSVFITVNASPIIDLGADTNLCFNHSITLDAGAGFASYLWNTGATTQTISLDSLTFSIGNNDYSVEVTNSNNCSNSDTITLIVDPCTGILTPALTEGEINIFPNPNKGQFQIDISGLENQTYDLGIYNSIGVKVFGDKVELGGQSTKSYKIDFSSYPSGIYFIKLQSEGQIKVKRLIIQ